MGGEINRGGYHVMESIGWYTADDGQSCQVKTVSRQTVFGGGVVSYRQARFHASCPRKSWYRDLIRQLTCRRHIYLIVDFSKYAIVSSSVFFVCKKTFLRKNIYDKQGAYKKE